MHFVRNYVKVLGLEQTVNGLLYLYCGFGVKSERPFQMTRKGRQFWNIMVYGNNGLVIAGECSRRILRFRSRLGFH